MVFSPVLYGRDLNRGFYRSTAKETGTGYDNREYEECYNGFKPQITRKITEEETDALTAEYTEYMEGTTEDLPRFYLSILCKPKAAKRHSFDGFEFLRAFRCPQMLGSPATPAVTRTKGTLAMGWQG